MLTARILADLSVRERAEVELQATVQKRRGLKLWRDYCYLGKRGRWTARSCSAGSLEATIRSAQISRKADTSHSQPLNSPEFKTTPSKSLHPPAKPQAPHSQHPSLAKRPLPKSALAQPLLIASQGKTGQKDARYATTCEEARSTCSWGRAACATRMHSISLYGREDAKLLDPKVPLAIERGFLAAVQEASELL